MDDAAQRSSSAGPADLGEHVTAREAVLLRVAVYDHAHSACKLRVHHLVSRANRFFMIKKQRDRGVHLILKLKGETRSPAAGCNRRIEFSGAAVIERSLSPAYKFW